MYVYYTVKHVILASENIRERAVFCPEELFTFFIFAAVFIVGVSNVGGGYDHEQASVCRELRARLPCLQEVWQATIGEELDCWRELNNRLQRVFLAYVFDTDLVGQVKLSFALEVH